MTLCLRIILLYFAFGSTYLVFRYMSIYQDLVWQGRLGPLRWTFLASAILSVFTLISVVGLWLKKKWGFFLFIISQVLGLLVVVATPLFEPIDFSALLPQLMIGLLLPVILIVLIAQKWHHLE